MDIVGFRNIMAELNKETHVATAKIEQEVSSKYMELEKNVVGSKEIRDAAIQDLREKHQAELEAKLAQDRELREKLHFPDESIQDVADRLGVQVENGNIIEQQKEEIRRTQEIQENQKEEIREQETAQKQQDLSNDFKQEAVDEKQSHEQNEALNKYAHEKLEARKKDLREQFERMHSGRDQREIER